jgi:hypothetical protein
VGIQIAQHRVGANVVSLVGFFDMQRMAVGVGVNGHRFDAHFLARTHNAYGDFTSVGDEYFPDHALT